MGLCGMGEFNGFYGHVKSTAQQLNLPTEKLDGSVGIRKNSDPSDVETTDESRSDNLKIGIFRMSNVWRRM